MLVMDVWDPLSNVCPNDVAALFKGATMVMACNAKRDVMVLGPKAPLSCTKKSDDPYEVTSDIGTTKP